MPPNSSFLEDTMSPACHTQKNTKVQSGQRSNLSKALRLPSAGAKLGAQVGYHQAADSMPRAPCLWEGKHGPEKGTGSALRAPRPAAQVPALGQAPKKSIFSAPVLPTAR